MDDLCEILVRSAIYGEDVHDDPMNLRAPNEDEVEPEEGIKYKLHAGYRRVIAGFLREIALMQQDKLKEHNCLFRATYLLEVLDHFADKLPGITVGAESRWRSRALNPLLQRQLRGTFDQAPMSVMLDVRSTKEEAAEYYLTRDPLDPKERESLLVGILYVWPVRWSLGHLTIRGTDENYTRTREGTEVLLKMRSQIPDEEWDTKRLWDYEEWIIGEERLTQYYGYHMQRAVSHLNSPPERFTLMDLS